jgi:hypothetical protein
VEIWFEFSIDNVVVRPMSSNRVFTTTVSWSSYKVKTRYGVELDGRVAEAAWGTGAFETII